MKKQIILYLLALWSALPYVHAQEIELKRQVENLEFITANFPQTKVFVHTDKPYYAIGDEIWYALYATSAYDHSDDAISKLAYVILEDPEGNIMSEQSIVVSGKFSKGDIAIDPLWKEGLYTLKAYTNYMKNFDHGYIFSKEIPIWSKSISSAPKPTQKGEKSIGVRFFPEGGYLIDGINTKVAFEVVGTDIEEITILDQEGAEVAKGKTIIDGMGYFSLLPINGNKYVAIVENEKFPLPTSQSSGYTVSVNTLHDENIFIDITASEGHDLSNTFVIGHLRGMVYLQQTGMSGKSASMKIDKSSLPEGVSQITLFDEKGKPLTERTFFNKHNTEPISVKATIPYSYLNKRQKTDLEIVLADHIGMPIDGNFSISVVDSDRVIGKESDVNIKSYLLLASEFTSHIKNPNQYFTTNDKKSRFNMDILMMTKGWTRIKKEEVFGGKEPKIEYIPEEGFTVTGSVLHNGFPVKAKVDLSIVGEDFFAVSTESDIDGVFSIRGLDFRPNANIYIKATTFGEDFKHNSKGVRLIVNSDKLEHIKSNQNIIYSGPNRSEISEYINTAYQIQSIDSMFDGLSVQIETVSVKAKRITRDQEINKERGIFYTNYDKRLFLDSIGSLSPFRTIFDIVADMVPGVSVVGNRGYDQRFRIRGGSNSFYGNTDATVLLDGNQVSYDMLNSLPIDNIEFIDVLRGLSSTAIYNAPNGLVAIYTKQPKDRLNDPYAQPDNVANITHKGYYESREFYSPDYSTTFAGAEKPDLRTTLYWNPRVTTNGGKATLSFHTADQLTDYLIEIQGITNDGLPFVGYTKMQVR